MALLKSMHDVHEILKAIYARNDLLSSGRAELMNFHLTQVVPEPEILNDVPQNIWNEEDSKKIPEIPLDNSNLNRIFI